MTTAVPDLHFDLAQVDPADQSMAERLALLDPDARADALADVTENDARALEWDWDFWARPDQKEPPEFRDASKKVWVVRAGRGFGKTRTGAETTRDRLDRLKTGRIHLIGPTAGDVRDVMVEGDSGILAVFPSWQRPHYEPSKRRVTFHNGAVATTFSADEPERLRGPQCEWFWGDEPASWRYGEDAFDNLAFGHRLGVPQGILTGTPKVLQWLIEIIEDADTVETRGSSYRNLANLAPSFIRRILARYEGTRLGLQEIHAEILEDVEGALWTRAMIEETRIRPTWDADGFLDLPPLARIVVAVDPSGTSTGDEAGIIVAGKDLDERGYVLDDRTVQGSPEEWATAAVAAFDEWDADVIIGEKNYGGDMVEAMIRGVRRNVSYRGVSAKKGKRTRAEPVAQVFEQARAHLVGSFGDLETEMTQTIFDGSEDSPNRVDAMVYALTDLLVMPKRKVRVR